MDHRNVVRKIFKGLGVVLCIWNLFKLIRVINRTNSREICSRIGEDIDQFSKRPPPKNFFLHNSFKEPDFINLIQKIQSEMSFLITKSGENV